MSHVSKAPPRLAFEPKLLTVWREGYGAADLKRDAVAGLTVAIVALPLSMGIAIASGLSPEHGLFAAIVGGFLVSLLGGSRFQIGGPAGAFIVLVAASVHRHGVDGMLLATGLSGLMMLAFGALRLGSYIKFVPYPVTVGFTAGIALIIFASQLKDALGLALAAEPPALWPKLQALAGAIGSVSPAALAITALTIALILGVRRFRPNWPALLIAIVGASLAAFLFGLPVETIGTRFGAIPNMLQAPVLPPLDWAKIQAVLPDAIGFAVLGAIESLLSAAVADGMGGGRHYSNVELAAQGVANVGAALFGAMPITGTIARTATNIRSGARGPIAGMLHAAFLLGFMLVAAPLVAYIPLAALAAMLAVIAWSMAERETIAGLVRRPSGDGLVVLATFLLTAFYDLLVAIAVGTVMSALLLLRRMADQVGLHGDATMGTAEEEDPEGSRDGAVMVFRLSGPLFFGVAPRLNLLLDRLGQAPKLFILDVAAVSLVDSTAAQALYAALDRLQRSGAQIAISGASPSVRCALMEAGLRRPAVRFSASIAEARRWANSGGSGA